MKKRKSKNPEQIMTSKNKLSSKSSDIICKERISRMVEQLSSSDEESSDKKDVFPKSANSYPKLNVMLGPGLQCCI